MLVQQCQYSIHESFTYYHLLFTTVQFDRFCQLVAALPENLKNILKIDENENLSNRADAHWLLHTEAFLLNVWRWPMKQTFEEKRGIFPPEGPSI